MKPEEKARQIINQKLEDAGWKIVPRDDYSPVVSAVAVEEGILGGNLEADYLLFLDGKAIGVLEAKRGDCNLSDIAIQQAENYTKKLLKWYQCWQNPLPFVYLSNGRELLFRDTRAVTSDYEPLQKMHTPREIAKMANLPSEYAGLPSLSSKGLRVCQFEAITELENSLRRGGQRALMVLATGAGKTYTACMAAYRLLSYSPVRRILFLVDRNNLGKQAEGAFGQFRLTETGDPFNTIFVTERLKSASIPPESNVVISTIQRLFAVLTGQEVTEDDDNEEGRETENENIVELGDNVTLPSDFFDVIIVDECHRSIYGRWQKVLTYFNKAKIIGLTATPIPETLAFFNNNLVVNYTLEKSIADGVNLDYRTYRIQTEATTYGGTICKDEKIKEVTKYTGQSEWVAMEDDIKYECRELDRSVINHTQIKLVLEHYKNAIYTDLYPDREPLWQYIPKTLIFAKSDAHATNIVNIIKKEIFPDQSDDFVQKITYSAGNSVELIRKFNNDKTFRIAVTVTLVATGTDIPSIEVLLFMRDVESEILYTQMRGRGVRTIGDEQLRNVTPNAISKDLFYLVDAVGITEHDKSLPPLDSEEQQSILSLENLLEQITHGHLPDDHLRLLASRLSRINHKSNEKQRNEFAGLAHTTMYDLAVAIFETLENNTLPPFNSANETNEERKVLVRLLANNPQTRKYLLVLNAGFVKILIPGEDTLIMKGFSQEEAHSFTKAFEEYVENHKDEIEALRIIYNNQGEPITYVLLKDLEEKLYATNSRFNARFLWNAYAITNPKDVVPLKSSNEKDALTNLIQLVRYAFHTIPELKSLPALAAQRFELWCGQAQRPLTETQKGIIKQIVGYIVSNGTYTNEELRDENITVFAQLVQNFGSADVVDEVLESLSGWMLKAG